MLLLRKTCQFWFCQKNQGGPCLVVMLQERDTAELNFEGLKSKASRPDPLGKGPSGSSAGIPTSASSSGKGVPSPSTPHKKPAAKKGGKGGGNMSATIISMMEKEKKMKTTMTLVKHGEPE